MKLIFTILFWLIGSVIAGELTDLKIEITKEIPESECKIKATSGDLVSVHYTGRLLSDDKVFDSSFQRNKPIDFVLGRGYVISGWDKGVNGMCIGEERTLYIPSDMGYGARGAGGVIPPNADLIFETKLVDIQRQDEL
ncbi:probable FK506-binding protein 2 [Saccharomycodes ludwigii]|uniref:peptidylprolyl isomerase n=1 Tax=Saccharomycodes ludwigii TaxID=36035 RepID=A0A376BA27_9ASCO|nr:hypothetical protein SCDLUD_003832 [Saccharomycodes ludwigii]KAH3899554.1 hypothetical protein SCDLUD_003832 [Saccharomycodes ludwigii]SSD61394.1 probable FK506-binding protein 2 [Saccharomycodes ludwigii]